MADSTIAILGWIAIVAGALASIGSLFLATRQPDQRKAHLGRAALFGIIAVTMFALR